MPHEIVKPSHTRVDERGTFVEALNGGHWESLLCGRMRAGAVMGNHYHRRTAVFFFLTRGAVTIDFIEVATGARSRVSLAEHQGVMLETGWSHAIRFLEESDFIMMKSRRYDPADPDTFAYEVPVQE